MREADFEKHLLTDGNSLSIKTVRSRMTKARLIERHFETSIDNIVCDDDITYKTLLRIKSEMKDTNGNISNALRKYYFFINNKRFPALSEYENK